ncbi:MAG: hypothetical protein ACTS7E_04585, partial [Arsenophonus sp. NC-CH8-MAG3]
ESKGFKTEIIQASDGDVAGLKSATIKVSKYSFAHRSEELIEKSIKKLKLPMVSRMSANTFSANHPRTSKLKFDNVER